jgi:hypothetical protein
MVLNPSFSKVSIKICCVASSCGAIVVDNTKAADSSGLEKREEEKVTANSAFFKYYTSLVQATQAIVTTL